MPVEKEALPIHWWYFGAVPRVVWVYVLFFPNQVFVPALEPVIVRLLLISGSIVGALGLLVAQRRVRRLCREPNCHLAMSLLAAACLLVLGIATLYRLPVCLLAACVFLSGIVTGIQTSDWTCSYGTPGNAKIVCVSSAGSSAMGTALIVALFLVGAACPFVLFVLASPMPVLSHLLCVRYRAHFGADCAVAAREIEESDHKRQAPLPQLMAGFAAYGVAYGFTLGYLAFCKAGADGNINGLYALLTLVAAVALGILAAHTANAGAFSLRMLYAPVFPLFVAGMLFVLLAPTTAADAVLLPTNLGYFILVILADVALSMGADATGKEIRRVAPVGWCCLSSGFLVGSLAQIIMGNAGVADARLTVFEMCLVFCMVLADRFLLSPAIATLSELESPKEAAASDARVEPLNGNNDLTGESLETVLDSIATDFGLTPREREVLSLLARGRDAKHVQEELCVSIYTARTHIRRIYEKLAVHSRQELLDLIERRV